MGALARFLPSLGPAAGAFLNPWVLLVAVAIAAAGFTAGWKVEAWRWDASLTATAEANLKSLQSFFGRQRTNNQATARQIARDRTKLAGDRAAFDEEMRNAKPGDLVDVDCGKREGGQPAGGTAIVGDPSGSGLQLPAVEREEGPRVRLSARGCFMWNRALAVGLPSTYGGWLADANAACTGPVEVNVAIENVERNAEIANELRSVVIGWQTKACREGWWTGPECIALGVLR